MGCCSCHYSLGHAGTDLVPLPLVSRDVRTPPLRGQGANLPPPLVACAPRSRGTTAPPAPGCSWRSCAPRSPRRRTKYRERVREAGRACVSVCARSGWENKPHRSPAGKRARTERESRNTCLKASLPTSASGLHQQMQCIPPPPHPPHITASRFQPWPGDAWWCVALSSLPVRLSEPERVLGEKMSSVCLF